MKRLFGLFLCLVTCSGCAGFPVGLEIKNDEVHYIKASDDANQMIVLQSNIEKTFFYIDGKHIATGRRVKVLINDRKEHLVKAVPDGYIPKEEFIQPPYRDGFLLSFTYMIGEKTAGGEPNKEPQNQFVSSDIDVLPTKTASPSENKYAIIVGIEKYRNNLPNADFAARDANTFYEYATKVMGYSPKNVILLINEKATKSDFDKYIDRWLLNNVNQQSTVLFYYSGHGAPNVKDSSAYLVPYDGDPSFIQETGYSLAKLYKQLEQLKAKQVIVAIDSCFSGAGGRSVLAKGTRPLVIMSENEMTIGKNLVVLTASSQNQISSTYSEKGHGLFTYFFLKGIKNSLENKEPNLDIDVLYNYLKSSVMDVARRQNNTEQTPQLLFTDKKVRKLDLF